MKCRFLVSSVAGTHAVAAWLFRSLVSESSAAVTVGLYGGLGAGKTEFVRGFVHTGQYAGDVTSPTFVLESTYSLPEYTRQVCHWDLYRLKPTESEIELADERLVAGNILLVEWPEKLPWLADGIDIAVTLESQSAEGSPADSSDLPLARIVSVETFGGWREKLREPCPSHADVTVIDEGE